MGLAPGAAFVGSRAHTIGSVFTHVLASRGGFTSRWEHHEIHVMKQKLRTGLSKSTRTVGTRQLLCRVVSTLVLPTLYGIGFKFISVPVDL